MSHPKVIMTRKVPGQAMALLHSQCALTVWDGDQAVPRPWLLEHVSGAEGLYCLLTDSVDPEFLDQAKHLKVISTMAVGFDNIDIAAATASVALMESDQSINDVFTIEQTESGITGLVAKLESSGLWRLHTSSVLISPRFRADRQAVFTKLHHNYNWVT